MITPRVSGIPGPVPGPSEQGKKISAKLCLPGGTEIAITNFALQQPKISQIFSRLFPVFGRQNETVILTDTLDPTKTYPVLKRDVCLHIFQNRLSKDGEVKKQPQILRLFSIFRHVALQMKKNMALDFSYEGQSFSLIKTQKAYDFQAVVHENFAKGGAKQIQKTYSLAKNEFQAKAQPLSISPMIPINPKDIKDFENEIKTSQLLIEKGVPHILKMQKITHQDQITSYSEFCDRGDLLSVVVPESIDETDDQQPALSDKQKLDLLRQTSLGLSKMHEVGLVHMDIKPENIFVKTNPDGTLEAKIGDLGTTNNIGTKNQNSGVTYAYAAPEAKKDNYSDKMDAFSFGCMLYDFLRPSQHSPRLFPSTTFFNTCPQNVPEQHETILNQLSTFQDPFVQLIHDCVQRDPEKRPTMEEVHKRLQKIETLPQNKEEITSSMPSFSA